MDLGTKLYRQIVGIPMGTNCAPLVADLFLFCYERDFMTSLSDVKQAEIIEAFKSTSRYLDDVLNTDNPYFEGMVNCILKTLTFHSFRESGSTYSRLHHRLPKSFNADAISSLHFWKSIRKGNLYFGPLETM